VIRGRVGQQPAGGQRRGADSIVGLAYFNIDGTDDGSGKRKIIIIIKP